MTKYKVTVQKKDGVIYEGLMAVKEPQVVNGLYAIADESGGWRYIQRDEVSEIRFTPVTDEVKDDPKEPDAKPVDEAKPEVEPETEPKPEEEQPEPEEASEEE